MGKLIYATPAPLHGHIADGGNLDWAAPDEKVFAFIMLRHGKRI